MRHRASANVQAFLPNHPPETPRALQSGQPLISQVDYGIHNTTGDVVSAQLHEDSGLDVRDVIRAIAATLDEYFPGAPPKQREIMRDNIEIALLEGSSYRSLRKELEPSLLSQLDLPSPVRELTAQELQEVSGIGKRHPWGDRKADDARNPLSWLQDYYGKFIPGLLTNHIRRADNSIYPSLMKEIGRKGLPAGLDFPTRDENERRKMVATLRAKPDDPGVRKEALKNEKNRARGRAFRARHANLD